MEAVAPLSQSSPPSIYLEEAFEDVGPRVQHLRQAFRKSLASTVKRSTNDFAETVVPVKLTGERMQQVLNVMRAEMETYAQRATARFLPTTSSLIPKLNRLDAHVPSDSSSPSKADLQLRETKHVLEPTRLVQRMLEQERARHLPTMIGRLQALEQQNEGLRARVEQKRRQMRQHLAHLDTQRALLNEANSLVSSSASAPGNELEALVEQMRQLEYSKW